MRRKVVEHAVSITPGNDTDDGDSMNTADNAHHDGGAKKLKVA